MPWKERGTGRQITIIGLVLLLVGCSKLPVRQAPGDVADGERVHAASAETATSAPIASTEQAMEEQPPRAKLDPPAVSVAVTLRKGRGVAGEESYYDLWDRIQIGMTLTDWDHEEVQSQLRWYQAHPRYLERVVERARPFLYLIVEEVEKRGLPLDLALLPVVESAFQPQAYSPRHAAGLWQFIPATGRRFGLRQNDWYDGRRDVIASTRAALDYLQQLNARFDGDWLLALAAYNCGENAVSKAIEGNRQRDQAGDFWSLDLPRETERYVPKLLALSAIVHDPNRYQLNLTPIQNQPHLAVFQAKAQIDLLEAANRTGLAMTELQRYNPGLKRNATAPNGPHRLLLPIENAESLTQAVERGLTALSPGDYLVEKGDTLSQIAKRYATTVTALQQANSLTGTRIRAGHELLIPATASTNSGDDLPQQALLSADDAQLISKRLQYMVRKGDSLWRIARRFGVSLTQLREWNQLSNDRYLQPGEHLEIYLEGPDGVAIQG